MSKKTKRILLLVAIFQIGAIIALMALPKVVVAIPGRYRVALAERSPFLGQIANGVIEQVAPVGAALPAPKNAAELPAITIPAISLSTPTPEPSVEPATPTAVSDSSQGEDQPIPTPNPTSTPLPSPTPTFEPLPVSAKIDGIKRIQQSFNNCGPANLTQVLNWYGDDTSQAIAAEYLKPNPEDRNVSPWQLSDYVNEFTQLRSTVHSGGDIELLKRLIAAGFPVVIEKGYEPNTSSSEGWFGHYLTVFAFDDSEQVFYSMDTYLKVDETTGRADSYQEIEDYWRQFNYTFYVVYQPEQEQEVFSYVGPDLLDPMTMWEKAAQRAQADIDSNPNDAFAWYNLGTSLTRLGELTGNAEFYQNGAAAFDQALTIGLPPRMLWYEFRPYLAYMKTGRYEDMIELADSILASQGGQNVEETYLYKGHAMLFLGDVAGATSAYRRALELNENFYPAEIALQSIG